MIMKEKKEQVVDNSPAAVAFRRTVNIVSTVIVALVVLCALLIVGVRAFGFTPYIVLSPSMKEQYPPGSIVYVKEVDPDTLQVGDDITFQLSGDIPATHRIVEKVYETIGSPYYEFRTKGTNNEAPDANLGPPSTVIGKVFFSVPLLGFVVDFIQRPFGIYACAAGAILLIILMLLPDVIFPGEKASKGKKKKDETIEEPTAGPSEEAAPEAANEAEAEPPKEPSEVNGDAVGETANVGTADEGGDPEDKA